MGDYSLAFTQGRLDVSDSGMVLQPAATRHSPLMLGDLKLADFRKVLLQQGYMVELSAGILYLPEHAIIIRKNEKGRIIVEGRMSVQGLKIRTLLQNQFISL